MRERLEAVSPELVLVDPELARTERARLETVEWVEALDRLATTGRVVEQAPAVNDATSFDDTPTVPVTPSFTAARVPEPRPAWRLSGSRVTQLLLLLSVLANGILIANAVADSDGVHRAASLARSQSTGRTQASTTPHRAGPADTAAHQSTPPPRQSSDRHFAAHRETSVVAVERKVLARVVQSPAGKLPRALIDSATGLAKNNLQAVCRRSRPGSFLCLVRPAEHKSSEGLYMLYRPNARHRKFTWYPYQRG
jgi:hypothetical protein